MVMVDTVLGSDGRPAFNGGGQGRTKVIRFESVTDTGPDSGALTRLLLPTPSITTNAMTFGIQTSASYLVLSKICIGEFLGSEFTHTNVAVDIRRRSPLKSRYVCDRSEQRGHFIFRLTASEMSAMMTIPSHASKRLEVCDRI